MILKVKNRWCWTKNRWTLLPKINEEGINVIMKGAKISYGVLDVDINGKIIGDADIWVDVKGSKIGV